MMAIALRIFAAIAVMLAVGALAFALSRGHLLLLPFVLVLGAPLWFFRRR